AVTDHLAATWEAAAGLTTFGEAALAALERAVEDGTLARADVDHEAWRELAAGASWRTLRERLDEIGLRVTWDAEPARTPDGHYQVRGGIGYAIAKSLAAAPFADVLWMETKTADLDEARAFA